MKKNGLFYGFIIIAIHIYGANPVIKNIGMSDPHIRVFNDTAYLFSGHDADPGDKLWVMKDWRVFSSTDLVNWKLETTISPKDNYMDDNSIDCWAGDAAERNGKYYFYFSDKKYSVGVMQSEKPGGPYTDALGKPLVSPMHDPTLFVDNDPHKTPYLVYGDKEGGGYHIAQVKENMISLKEKPKPIVIHGEEWDNAPKWMDKNYLFKYKDTYYLSWGRDYATSKNVYGPYQCVGSVGNGHHLDPLAHGSFFWFHGQFYHIWTYYIRPGYKYRECIITYCHFDADGNIVTDTNFLDKHFEVGVGQYKASWPKIEAEWYSGKSASIFKKENSGTFVLAGIKADSWVKFANMDFGMEIYKFTAEISNVEGSGQLEIRVGSENGRLLGKVDIHKTAGTDKKQTVSCILENIQGVQNLYLVFKGNEALHLQMDFFSLEKDETAAIRALEDEKVSIYCNPGDDGLFYIQHPTSQTMDCIQY